MGFQLMLILGLLNMYFDAAVLFVTKSSLLFRLAVAILCDTLLMQGILKLVPLHLKRLFFANFSSWKVVKE